MMDDDASKIPSRRSSVSISLTTASTAHSPPADSFDDLFGTAVDTPTQVFNFEDAFLPDVIGGGAMKPVDTMMVEPFAFDGLVDFDGAGLVGSGADPLKGVAVADFVDLDQHDFHDQDHFVIFSDES